MPSMVFHVNPNIGNVSLQKVRPSCRYETSLRPTICNRFPGKLLTLGPLKQKIISTGLEDACKVTL